MWTLHPYFVFQKFMKGETMLKGILKRVLIVLITWTIVISSGFFMILASGAFFEDFAKEINFPRSPGLSLVSALIFVVFSFIIFIIWAFGRYDKKDIPIKIISRFETQDLIFIITDGIDYIQQEIKWRTIPLDRIRRRKVRGLFYEQKFTELYIAEPEEVIFEQKIEEIEESEIMEFQPFELWEEEKDEQEKD